MKKTLAAVLVVAVVLGVWLLQGQAAAQEKAFPARQLTYLVCFDPGGGGALGWRELTHAKPDGYTFAGFNIPHVILQPLQQDVGYKTEQIVPLMIFQRTPLGLAVLDTSPFKTLKEFVDHAKQNPGAVSIGGSGSFSGYHMATLRFEKLTGTKITYVPFTGSAPQMTAFLGGHINAIFGASDDLTIHKDKLRVLGFATNERFPGFPDAPTLKEQGVDMAEAVDRGVAVPPGTPDPIIKKLESAFLQVANMPEIRTEMTRQGFIPMAMGHAESKAYLEKMTALYKDLAAGIKK